MAAEPVAHGHDGAHPWAREVEALGRIAPARVDQALAHPGADAAHVGAAVDLLNNEALLRYLSASCHPGDPLTDGDENDQPKGGRETYAGGAVVVVGGRGGVGLFIYQLRSFTHLPPSLIDHPWPLTLDWILG